MYIMNNLKIIYARKELIMFKLIARILKLFTTLLIMLNFPI